MQCFCHVASMAYIYRTHGWGARGLRLENGKRCDFSSTLLSFILLFLLTEKTHRTSQGNNHCMRQMACLYSIQCFFGKKTLHILRWTICNQIQYRVHTCVLTTAIKWNSSVTCIYSMCEAPYVSKVWYCQNWSPSQHNSNFNGLSSDRVKIIELSSFLTISVPTLNLH